ncbi:MAG: hypothetical protein ACRDSZ_05970 [Pseudonocardiaceae bacterium]
MQRNSDQGHRGKRLTAIDVAIVALTHLATAHPQQRQPIEVIALTQRHRRSSLLAVWSVM